MFKLSNNNLPISNIKNKSAMKNSPNNNLQIIKCEIIIYKIIMDK